MNELEALLREQLHKAADPIEVPVDEVAVLDAGRRARTARTLRWVVLGLALLAAASAALFAVWQGALREERRAVPDPLQTPTTETVVPTPSGSPTTVPGSQGEAALIDFHFRDQPSTVRVESIAGGLRFTGVDVGDGRSIDIAEGGQHSGEPEQGWVLATMPKGTTWAMFVAADDATRMMGGVQQVVAVPGTDLVAYALIIPKADAYAPGTIRIIRGDAQGNVFKQVNQAVFAQTFTSLNGRPVTWFVDDEWQVAGVVDHEIDYVGHEPVRRGYLPGVALGGPDADSLELMLVLPAGADAASLNWGFPDTIKTVLGPTTRSLPDGRTMVHQGFRGPDVSDHPNPEFTVTYTVNGTLTSAPVALGP